MLDKIINKKNIRETISFIGMVVLIFAFRSSFFEPFRIPSGSMIPTLNIGDFIVVNKFSYGFKLPFSDMFSDPIYLSSFESPKRFDVVVFKYPVDPSLNYIKRVIGVPGDEIEIINKKVFVNGKEVNAQNDTSELTAKFAKDFSSFPVSFFKVKESDKEFYFQESDQSTRVDNLSKIKVPANTYFCMGDNRDFSADSRYWGFVPQENIKGKAIFVWMSLTLPLLDDMGFSFSPSRIGNLIK